MSFDEEVLTPQMPFQPCLPRVLLYLTIIFIIILFRGFSINNLLNNAIKYTEIGGITLTAKRDEYNAVIEIRDTGIGVSKELFEAIFEPFRQASEGYSRKYEGTGLGLTLAKKFTDLMGGTITLESNQEDLLAGKAGGSALILKFPLNKKTEDLINNKWDRLL